MYGTPAARVRIGDLEVTPESVRISSDRRAPIARAEIALDRDLSGRLEVGQDLVVALGYLGQALTPAFRGRIWELRPERLVRIVALDRMKDLTDVTIRQAFRNVTLQEVVSWCLEYAGVSDYTLSSRDTPRRHHFVAAQDTALDVLRRATQAWGVDWDCYADADGVVWVLPWEESPRAQAAPVAELEYGDDLTALEPRLQGTGMAETFLAPWVQHSHRVRLRDDRLWGAEVLVRVERVEHTVDSQRARTRIEWTLLAN